MIKGKPSPGILDGWMGDEDSPIDAYRDWLVMQHDLAQDAHYMYTKECPDEIAALKAEWHAKAFEEALEALDYFFGLEERE